MKMMAASQSFRIRGRWVFPVDVPPIEYGAIEVVNGRIAAVFEARGVNKEHFDVDFDGAILPGLVNAHTHLDLSGLRGKVPPSNDFTGWLRAVIQHRRSLAPEQVQQDVQNGLKEAIFSGTTLLGDISAGGSTWPVLADAAARATVYYELLGLPEERANAAWQAGREWVEHHPATATCRPGLSPHAPYSVRRSLFERVARYSASEQIPIAIHLAETQAELELLRNHTGPFEPFLNGLGVFDPSGLAHSPEDVIALTEASHRVAFAHGNYLSPGIRLAENQTVVYCPRTHAAFGHSKYPLQAMLRAGCRVAIGTDSLASNPDLDMLAELRFLHQQHPEIDGKILLEMATINGAYTLGWDHETGTLTPGKSADLIAVAFPSANEVDPYERLLDANSVASAVCFGANRFAKISARTD